MSDKDKTMSDDLAERLRDRRVCSLAQNSCRNDWICEQAADRIEELEERLKAATDDAKEAEAYAGELEAKLAKAVELAWAVTASLSAAIFLLERGGKKAVASDKMFAQMLVDYNTGLDRFRTAITELTGGKDE